MRTSLFAVACLFSAHLYVVCAAPDVTLMRVPDRGLQPQTAVGVDGTVHLVYLAGTPAACDVFYSTRAPGQTVFSKSIRVNSQPGTAVATGTIRGAQLALGKNGRVHVVWNGSQASRAKGESPDNLFYTRMNEAGKAFEPQRNLMTRTKGLDGGGSVAADESDNVFAIWHAAPPENQSGESGRAVFVSRSNDGGRTFAPETRANPDANGACGCCGLQTFASPDGTLFALYRTARQSMNRDATLLASRDAGKTFQSVELQKWMVGKCPMSSFSLSSTHERILAAWETNGKVFWSSISARTLAAGKPIAPTGGPGQKHPRTVANMKGDTLLIWTEGTGWQKGGLLAWQVYDADGKSKGELGRMDGVPVWSFASAFAEADGRFTILY